MSRQLEQAHEDKMRRKHDALIRALEFELVDNLRKHGAELYGFSVKVSEWECLMTLRAEVDGVSSVCFVGAEDIVGVFVKSSRVAGRNNLKWKEDRFVG